MLSFASESDSLKLQSADDSAVLISGADLDGNLCSQNMLVERGDNLGLWNILGVRRRQICEAHLHEVRVAMSVVVADEGNLNEHPIWSEDVRDLAFD